MKRALISDIHGNLEALQAVLADIDAIGVDEIYCLGDIIGYGPNPCECLDLVMKRCKSTILGNHDQAALSHFMSAPFHISRRHAPPPEMR